LGLACAPCFELVPLAAVAATCLAGTAAVFLGMVKQYLILGENGLIQCKFRPDTIFMLLDAGLHVDHVPYF
jgi:hypothetical protein